MIKTTLLLISIGAVGSTLMSVPPMPDTSVRRTTDQKVAASNATRLDVKVPIGQVVLIADSSPVMEVHVVRSATSYLNRDAQRWLTKSYITAENRNGVLTVRDHPFGLDTLRGFDDANPKYGANRKAGNDHTVGLNADIQIHVPSNLAAKLDVSAGAASIRGNFKSLIADVAAGRLIADSVRCTGPSTLKVGAGEVKLKMPTGSNADVTASVGVGHISGLPGGQPKRVGLHFGDRRHGRTGQGDSKVSVHVGAGNINVLSADRILASIDPEDADSDGFDTEDAGADMTEPGHDDRSDPQAAQDTKAAVHEAMEQAKEALKQAQTAFKFDMKDLKLDGLDGLDGLDKTMSEALAQIGPEIERAMAEAEPDIQKAMKDAKPEDRKRLEKLRPELEKTLKTIGPEIQRAMKNIKPQIEKLMRDLKPTIEKAMKNVKPEVEQAIKKAMEEVDRAQKEMKSKGD